MKFMMLPEQWSGEDSEVYILPIEYEGDVCRGKGCAKGAEEIIKASCDVEPYEEQFNIDAFKNGIYVLPTLKFTNETPEKVMEIISKEVAKYKDKFLICIGGSHAITMGIVEGFEDDFSVLVLDAHPDLRESWGTKFSHACTSNKISKQHSIGIIGVRAMDIDEHKLIENSEQINILKSYDYSEEKVNQILSKLKDKVYLSIDVDVFDPSFIKNTGTPEPDGLYWPQIINILKKLFTSKQVIGCDLVEFAPKENYKDEAYYLAKLIYKIIALHNKLKSPKQ